MQNVLSTEEQAARYHAYAEVQRLRRCAYAKQYRARNPEKTKADVRKWKKENPEKRREQIRAGNIKNRYGVTRERHREMYAEQDNKCAICRVDQSQLKKRFCIDHDHGTGMVRGLICSHCNYVLGHARDDVKVLSAAISYLEKYKK